MQVGHVFIIIRLKEVFATNSNFLIPSFLQPKCGNLCTFELRLLRLLDLTEFTV